MTMFKELFDLAKNATLTMVVSAEEKTGQMTICVIPKPRKDTGESALTKELSLTATPVEFDAGFVAALSSYQRARQSLAAQVEATQEVLQAARAASAKKAGDALSKASKPGAVTVKPAPVAPSSTADAAVTPTTATPVANDMMHDLFA